MINFDEQHNPAQDTLTDLASLVARMLLKQQAVADYEEMLKEVKRDLRMLEEVDIPEMMQAAGLEAVTLENGKTLTVKETMYASIAAKNKTAAAQWLISNGLSALVKEDIVVPFDKGQVEEATTLANLLASSGYTFKQVDSINTTSVKAAIKELLEQGYEVPLELFGAHFAKKAVLK